MTTTHTPAWHRTTGMRRCCRCTEPITKGEHYWGSAQSPDAIWCYSCKTQGLSGPVAARLPA